jgi:hypothetical protein
MDHQQPEARGQPTYAPPQNGSPLPLPYGLPPLVSMEHGMMDANPSVKAAYGSFVPPPSPQHLNNGLPFDAMNQLASIPPQFWNQFAAAAGTTPHMPGLHFHQPPQASSQGHLPHQLHDQNIPHLQAPQPPNISYPPSLFEDHRDYDLESSSHESSTLPNVNAVQSAGSTQDGRSLIQEQQLGKCISPATCSSRL